MKIVYNLFSLLAILITKIYALTLNDEYNITLDTTTQFKIQTGCSEIKIPNNYKRLVLNINSTNIDKMVITDVKINECKETENIINCCARNSTFCSENHKPVSNEFRVNYCIDNTYIYACTFDRENNSSNQGDENSSDSSNKESSVTVSTNIIKGLGCTTNEFIPETECSSIGLDVCKDQDRCVKQCSYVECRKDVADIGTKVFSMCVPSSLSADETVKRCSNHIQFKDTAPQVYSVPCTREVTTDELRKDSSHKFFKLLLIVFGTILLITFISSIYYRFKINLDGTPPFEPPFFCPQFIYPKN
jgi:hypothetical protein